MSPIKMNPILKSVIEKAPFHLYAWGIITIGIIGVKALIKIEANQLNQGNRIQNIELWQNGVNIWKEQTNIKMNNLDIFKQEQGRVNESLRNDHYELAGEVHEIQDKLKKR